MSPNGIRTYKIRRKSETKEWVVRTYIDGKLDADCDYFTDSKKDAEDTKAFNEAGYPKPE